MEWNCLPDRPRTVSTSIPRSSALAKIRNYANAMDWRQQLTTFTGDEPMRPSLLPTKEAAAKVRMNGMRKFMPNVFWNENQIAFTFGSGILIFSGVPHTSNKITIINSLILLNINAYLFGTQ